MPRGSSAIGNVLKFFRSATLEIAETALDLAKDAVRERRATGAKISEAHKRAAAKSKRARKPAVTAGTGTGTGDGAEKPARRKPGPKPGSRKKKPVVDADDTANAPLPLQTSSDDTPERIAGTM